MNSLRILAGPLIGFVSLFVLTVPFCVLLLVKGGEISKASSWLYNATYGFLVAWGVERDRKARQIPAPFEYGAFMFFLWWAMLPVYLFKTRGWRGFVAALAILLASSLPSLIALGIYALLGDAL